MKLIIDTVRGTTIENLFYIPNIDERLVWLYNNQKHTGIVLDKIIDFVNSTITLRMVQVHAVSEVTEDS